MSKALIGGGLVGFYENFFTHRSHVPLQMGEDGYKITFLSFEDGWETGGRWLIKRKIMSL